MSQSLIQQLQSNTGQRVLHRVWIMSDLQQDEFENARVCLTQATEDFRSLELECDQIWYLGDAVQGSNRDILQQMISLQIELLTPFNIPLKFACGNHDFDPYWAQIERGSPLGEGEKLSVLSYQQFSDVPGWRSSEKISDLYYKDTLGAYTLFFFPDHADERCAWIAAGGEVHGDASAYPHDEAAYLAVRDLIENTPGPVITAGHTSFSGGLRGSALLSRMLPLPSNVRAHFYGHSHIGEAFYGGPACFRKLSTVDTQNIPQFDVAALENYRADAIRSTLLEIYEDGSFGVLFREHCNRRWSDAYFIANNESTID